jgi:integrase
VKTATTPSRNVDGTEPVGGRQCAILAFPGEIPIPTKLVKKLKAWKAKSDKTCDLVFPTSGCNPKLDFLDCLKACAERGELDKDNFWLHKFRSTFATRCLWAGVDIRTVAGVTGAL